jgi:hypothetical protein
MWNTGCVGKTSNGAMPAANTPMPATNASMFTPYAPMFANAYGTNAYGTNALWSYSDALYTSNALHESYAISNVLHASYAGNANDVLADDDAWHDARYGLCKHLLWNAKCRLCRNVSGNAKYGLYGIIKPLFKENFLFIEKFFYFFKFFLE